MKSVEVVEANFLSQLSAAAAEMVMYTGKGIVGKGETLWNEEKVYSGERRHIREKGSFRVGKAEILKGQETKF